jgi:4-carboxymuconolactone decarboxylase
MKRVILGSLVTLVGMAATEAHAQSSADIVISRAGSRPSRLEPAEHFTGVVRIVPLFDSTAASRISGSSVSFEARARTAWHSHPRGQTLIVISGVGRVQRADGRVEEIRLGDVVWIPPGVKHWHGASPNQAMTQIAVQEHLNGRFVDWQERVSDAEYAVPVQRSGDVGVSAAARPVPTVGREAFGDIAPALGGITDTVLFGNVWQRPGLSPRDRSFITVAALVAMYRTNELPSHLRRALDNGVSRDELAEVIPHLAFYAGWPAANSAVQIARQVFAERAR